MRPKALGGGPGKRNIRFACHACNNERGVLTSHHCYYKFIEDKVKRWKQQHPDAVTLFRWLARVIRRYNKRSIAVKPLYEKWVALELERLGESPSSKIKVVWEIPLENFSACFTQPEQLEFNSCVVQSTPELSIRQPMVMSG